MTSKHMLCVHADSEIQSSEGALASQNSVGILRQEAGSRATFANVTFAIGLNLAFPSAAGALAHLNGNNSRNATSAAWFYGISWQHASRVPAASRVAVENRHCYVYTHTQLPTVWDKELWREMAAWQLTPAPDPSPGN